VDSNIIFIKEKGACFMPSNKRVFTLRLRDEYFDKLEAVAKIEHRSLTNLIELAVIKYLKEYEDANGKIDAAE